MPPEEPRPQPQGPYQHPDFTNTDPRLRPVIAPAESKVMAKRYLVAGAFPQLYRDFLAIEKRAGIPHHVLVVSDEIPTLAAHILKDPRVIIINRAVWNSMSYDELLGVVIGHEIGHAWRHANQTHPLLPEAKPFTGHNKAYEMESDLLGACLAGNLNGFRSWMKNTSHGDAAGYPTNEELANAFGRMRWRNCPSGMIPHSRNHSR